MSASVCIPVQSRHAGFYVSLFFPFYCTNTDTLNMPFCDGLNCSWFLEINVLLFYLHYTLFCINFYWQKQDFIIFLYMCSYENTHFMLEVVSIQFYFNCICVVVAVLVHQGFTLVNILTVYIGLPYVYNIF